jgi:hypothetical protein
MIALPQITINLQPQTSAGVENIAAQNIFYAGRKKKGKEEKGGKERKEGKKEKRRNEKE